jgi:fluoride exporter
VNGAAAVALVAAGGAAGALARAWLAPRVARMAAERNYGTWAVNVVGSLLLGVVLTAGGEPAYLLLGAGLAGALTTFSAFAADLDVMRAERRWAGLGVYAALTIVASLAAVAAGAWVGASIAG